LYYAALIHSGYIVKDPLYFSQNVFELINTALGVKSPIEEIEVTDEDLLSMEPPAEEKPVDSEASKTDEVIDLDSEASGQSGQEGEKAAEGEQTEQAST
jgi:hypothetical protein